MIIMPTRGYGRFRRMLLGSVAVKVLTIKMSRSDRAAFGESDSTRRMVLLTAYPVRRGPDVGNRPRIEVGSGNSEDLGAHFLAFHVVAPVDEGMLARLH